VDVQEDDVAGHGRDDGDGLLQVPSGPDDEKGRVGLLDLGGHVPAKHREPTPPDVGQHACVITLLQLLPQLLPPFPKSLRDRQPKGPFPASPQVTGPFSWRRMGDSNPRGLAPNTLSNCVFRCSGESTNVYRCRSRPVADDDRRRSTSMNKRELLPKLLPAGKSGVASLGAVSGPDLAACCSGGLLLVHSLQDPRSHLG